MSHEINQHLDTIDKHLNLDKNTNVILENLSKISYSADMSDVIIYTESILTITKLIKNKLILQLSLEEYFNEDVKIITL